MEHPLSLHPIQQCHVLTTCLCLFLHHFTTCQICYMTLYTIATAYIHFVMSSTCWCTTYQERKKKAVHVCNESSAYILTFGLYNKLWYY